MKLRFKVTRVPKNSLLKIIRATRTIVTTSTVMSVTANLGLGHRSTWVDYSAESVTIKLKFQFAELVAGQLKAESFELLKRLVQETAF